MRGQTLKLNKFSFLVAIILMLPLLSFYPEAIMAETDETGSANISVYPSFSAEDLLSKTNAIRGENAIGTLSSDEKLQKAAQRKAEDMAKNGYFAHTAPSGKTPWEWLDEEDYAYLKAGENLAVNFKNSSALIEGWMDSPSHKKNLLNGNFEEVGIGIAYGEFEGKKAVYVVEFYGTEEKGLIDGLLAMF